MKKLQVITPAALSALCSCWFEGTFFFPPKKEIEANTNMRYERRAARETSADTQSAEKHNVTNSQNSYNPNLRA